VGVDEVLLHLTDLHFGSDHGLLQADGRDLALRSLVTRLSRLEEDWRPSAVCISGDVAFAGRPSDYEAASLWISELLGVLDLPIEGLFLCPGNHDLDRSLAWGPRPLGFREADRILSPPLTDSLCRPFEAFSAFASKLGVPAYQLGSFQSHLAGVREFRGFRVICCNSAWFSQDDNDRGNLWLGLPLLRHLERHHQICSPPESTGSAGQPPIAIAIMHHPSDWLASEELNAWNGRQNARDYLCQRADVLLTGHTHAEIRLPDRIAGGALHFSSGATYDKQDYANVFSLLRFRSGIINYRAFRYEPTSATHEWQESPALPSFLFGSRSQVPGHPARMAEIRKTLRARATDLIAEKWLALGGEAPARPLPELRWSPVTVRARTRDMQHQRALTVSLVETVQASRKVFLTGDMGAGKSTALAQLAVQWGTESDDALACIVRARALSGASTRDELASLLDSHVLGSDEVVEESERTTLASTRLLIAIDALDEVTRQAAARLVALVEELLDQRFYLHVILAGRGVESAAIVPARWIVLEALPPTDRAALSILEEDSPSGGREQARRTLRKIRSSQQVQLLARTPLGLRLVSRAVRGQDSPDVLSLGEILTRVMLERLGAWDERDLKASATPNFESTFSDPLERFEIYARLVHQLWDEPPDEVRVRAAMINVLEDGDEALATEAIRFYEIRRLVQPTGDELFPIWPLAELAAGFAGALAIKKNETSWTSQDPQRWRVFSYALYFLERQGHQDLVAVAGERYFAERFLSRADVPVMAYVAAESTNTQLALAWVRHLPRLGSRPLAGFPFDFRAPAAPIARCLSVAGTEGFDWFYAAYLDPRYPYVDSGSALIEAVFDIWIDLARPFSEEQRAKLTGLIRPCLGAGVRIHSFVTALALTFPESLPPEERYWFAATQLASPNRGEIAAEILEAGFQESPALVTNLLSQEVSQGDANAAWAARWLLAHAGYRELDEALVRAALAAKVSPLNFFVAEEIQRQAIASFGNASWEGMLRWLLGDQTGKVAAAAALELARNGESRVGILGHALLRGMSEGDRAPDAEERLESLLKEGPKSVEWLVAHILEPSDREDFRVSGRWWALLLKLLEARPDAPNLLARCICKMRGFVLARHTDVVLSIRALFTGANGADFREALRQALLADDLRARRGAAMCLIAVEPDGNLEAWETLLATMGTLEPVSDREWSDFALELPISRVTLMCIHARLSRYQGVGRRFALLLLELRDFPLTAQEFDEVVDALFENSGLLQFAMSARRRLFHQPRLLSALKQRLTSLRGREQVDVASALLQFHSSQLGTSEAAMCLLLCNRPGRLGHWDLSGAFTEIEKNESIVSGLRAALHAQPELADLPVARYLAILDGTGRWQELLFAMLFGVGEAHNSLSEFEDVGYSLLRLGRERPGLGTAIGEAAVDLLKDPHVRASPWVDARHWLAVLAHEFDVADLAIVSETLGLGSPIHGNAAAALLARLGEVAPGVRLAKHAKVPPDRRPSLEAAEPNLLLRACSDVDEGHCRAVVRLISTSSSIDLTAVRGCGGVGPLLANVLDFCRNGTALSADAGAPVVSRLDRGGSNSCRQHLLTLWRGQYEQMFFFDVAARQRYVDDVHQLLLIRHGEILAWGAELLKLGQDLRSDELDILLGELVEAPWTYDWGFCWRLAKWLTTTSSETRRALLGSFRNTARRAEGLDLRDRGNLHDTGLRLLVVALGVWLVSDDVDSDATKLFLRGFRMMIEDANATRSTLGAVEPLLSAVRSDLLRAAARSAASGDEIVRGFFRFAEIFASAGDPDFDAQRDPRE
jgi:hypothetical protein